MNQENYFSFKSFMTTRNKILNVAREQFVKYGFNNVKTDVLAKEAGISKRTLYENFSSKEKLFEETIKLMLEELSMKINSIIEKMRERGSNIIDELKNLWALYSDTSNSFTKELFEDIKKVNPKILQMIEEFRSEQMHKNFDKVVSLGINKGIFRDDINYKIVFLIHYHSVQNILRPEVVYELPLSCNDVVAEIYDVLLKGLLTDKGRKAYKK